MANTKQKIDRWSSSDNTLLYVTQPNSSRTSTTEISAGASMSTNNESHNEQ